MALGVGMGPARRSGKPRLEPTLDGRMSGAMNLHWKRPLFYCLIPVFIFLAFVGFPPPFAPPLATKPGQEQSDQLKKKNVKR